MIPARFLVSGLAAVAVLLTGCGTTLMPARATLSQAQKPGAQRLLRGEPANYYAPVAGQQGRALLDGLRQLVGPHKDLGYDGARDVMFAQIDDLDSDNRVSCIYIGRTLEQVTGKDSAYQNGKGLNAEHTWPQSKGAVNAAKADLHHLFPADCHANSTRGSFPFGEVTSPEWSEGGSELGTNAQGARVFEVRPDHKGDTARAILYFYTVYGQLGSTSLENFKIEEPVLKAWHQQDPVTAAERARNDAVQAAQGNRNPFVDHPEFVGAVGTFLQAR